MSYTRLISTHILTNTYTNYNTHSVRVRAWVEGGGAQRENEKGRPYLMNPYRPLRAAAAARKSVRAVCMLSLSRAAGKTPRV